ncbi:MAG: glycosyltransferase [Deltaproteobacteria bacterium]|nr:glycosyltransferase [Deltaproteobacteria bacterium]
MRRETRLKIILSSLIFFITVLVGYKAYLSLFESDFYSVNLENINAIRENTQGKKTLSFIVVGNIENSIGIFDKTMVHKINADHPDFVISAGNAVADGAEDKYRILYKSLKKIHAPSVLCFGENESSDSGQPRFYDHFGPYYFSFAAGPAYFIFLDTTENTPDLWQRDWLEKTLEEALAYPCRFVVMNKPPYKITASPLMKKIGNSPIIDEIEKKIPLPIESNYIEDESYRQFLTETFARYGVNAVYSSNLNIYDAREQEGVSYFVTGGGGASLIVNNDASFYHYLLVTAGPEGITHQVVGDIDKHRSAPGVFIENLWVRIHSFFYISFINFLLVLAFFLILVVVVYAKLTKKVDYYRDFTSRNIAPDKKLHIAMFTNTFSPFIGGVPISIERLADGLRRADHTVTIFAPQYPGHHETTEHTVRCRRLIQYRDFAIVNIFSRRIRKEFNALDIDLVHVHHPFWLGSKGRRLARDRHIPVVLTYHTRLEKYAHNIPLIGFLFQNILPHYIIRRFSQKCDAVIAPTSTAREYLRNLGVSRRIAVQPTGVDLSLYDNVPKEKIASINESCRRHDGLLLVSVSRLTKEKNIYFLLEGIASVHKQTNIPFTVLLIGDGPERDSILRFIDKNELQKTVHLTGSLSQEELCAYYMAADLFIFASLSETQGMVLLEAMAGATPVVAVRSSGIEDAVRDGYNGYKTDPDQTQWVERIVELMADDLLRRKMSENARISARKHSTDKVAASVAKLYRKVLEESPSGE